MAASMNTVFLLLSEHKKLSQRILNIKEQTEEEERRKRIAVACATPHLTHRVVVVKTGIEWERMMSMDDNTFFRHLRVTKIQCDYLLLKLQEQGLTEEPTRGLPPVPVRQKVLMFLWYMANQNSFREISDKFNISQSTAHKAVTEVLQLFATLGHLFISWPTSCEKKASSAAFHRLCGTNGIIGAIDGCHIRVQRPKIRGGDYMNRKSYYSVLLQGICDVRGRFTDIFVGPPGRVHDVRMLRASHFYLDWQEKIGDYKLLGDSAYIGQACPFIVTPKRDNGALTVEDQERNTRVSRGRVIIEHAFGRMKCKWRRVRHLQNTRMDFVVMIIMAACFLHNMCAGVSEVCEEHPGGCPEEADVDA